MSDLQTKIKVLKDHVQEYPDFPKKGVLFRDIFSLFRQPEYLLILRDVLTAFAKKLQPVDCVVGLDARGFLLGPLISVDLKIPFVPVRKKGKLPGNVKSASYALEYGEDILEIQEDSIKKGQRVLVVDDLLATGGSLGAACNLVETMGGIVASCLVLMELTELGGRSKISSDVISILEY